MAAAILICFGSFPEMKDVFLSSVATKLPFITPDPSSDIDVEDPQELERISGIVHVYGALLSYSCQGFDKNHIKLDINDAWKFVASFLNRDLNTTLHKSSVPSWMLHAIPCTSSLAIIFFRLLTTIRNELYPKLPKHTLSSNQALMLLVESILHGDIKRPDGFVLSE